MPACLNSRYIKKPLDDSDLSQSTFSPPADDTSTEKSGVNKNQMDIWSSILSGKEEQDSITNLDHPPPYIHPMVKRSASSLSDKSLEICTESLGSETGSDGFSAYDPMAEDDEFGSDPPKYGTVKIKNGGYSERPALPPPVPSLSLQMRSRRENGRLVMEAVSVAPFESCFRAERQDGRLLLLTLSEDEEIVVPDVAEVTSSGGLLKPYVYEYWRNKLQKPCKRTLVLLLKETIALPFLSNI